MSLLAGVMVTERKTTGQQLREASRSKYRANSNGGPITKVLDFPYCSSGVTAAVMGNSQVLMCVTVNVSSGIA